MALTWTNIDSITTRKFIPILADNIYKSNPLFLLLNGKGRIVLDGGRSIVEPVLYDKQPSGSYAQFATLDVTPKEIVTDLELQYKLYYAAASVSEHDLLKNYGSSRVLDFLAAQMQNMEATLKDLIGGDLFKEAPGANDIDSLFVAVDDNNTYAGIDRTVTPGSTFWKATYVDAAGAEPSFAEFQKRYGQATQGDTSPDLIVVVQEVFNKLWSLSLPQQRYAEGDDITVGWPYIRFNRARIMVDSHIVITANTAPAYFLNLDFVSLIVHTLRDFSFTGWLTGINQDARTGRVHWAGNAVVNNPRFQAIWDNVSTA